MEGVAPSVRPVSDSEECVELSGERNLVVESTLDIDVAESGIRLIMRCATSSTRSHWLSSSG